MSVFDVLIVGAGLSGAVVAERFATQSQKKVLIIDKRPHVGGNCYDYVDNHGILISKYGAHLFHTNYQDVWEYVNKFSEWQRWDHRVLGFVDRRLVPIPVNINTVNALCGTSIKDSREMDKWLDQVQVKYNRIANSKEMAESRVGTELYSKIFKDYTFKQWNKYPEELDPSVLARLPIRNNFDDRYFDDKFQALPKNGYTHFVNNLLSHPKITVLTDTDYFSIINDIHFKTLIFTGPIDVYYKDSGLERLEYRSIDFIIEHYKSMNYYQPNSVVNYPGMNEPFTRIVEYKHFLNQQVPDTTIVKEITSESGEPYYPIPDQRNLIIYEQYRKLANNEKNTIFLGRLANYKYFNMDQAIKNSLDWFNGHVLVS